METEKFNLDDAISGWLRRLSLQKGLTDDDYAEVESHLRDTIEALVRDGLSEKEGFFRALKGFGGDIDLAGKYRLANWEREVGMRVVRAPLLFGHHLKLAARSAWRQKGFTAINLSGLAIALACFVLISAYVNHELSYDRFFQDSDRIYRVLFAVPGSDGSEAQRVLTPGALADALVNELPEVEVATRVHRSYWGRVSLSRDKDHAYYGDDLLYSDESFFNVFSFRFLQGDRHSALEDPSSIVLTRSLAQRLFGMDSALGETLVLDGNRLLRVTGVIEDVPPTSHLQFEFVLSTEGVRPQWMHDWTSTQVQTYLRVSANASVPVVDRKMNMIRASHTGNHEARLSTQPVVGVRGIHLAPTVDDQPAEDRMLFVEVLSFIGLFILIIAGINYINLATARAAVRAREIGTRKVVGATKKVLVVQFLTESMLMSVVAGLVGVVLAAILLPSFGELVHKELSLHASSNQAVWGVVGAAVLILGIGAGTYPALYLAAFKPSSVFKKHVTAGRGRADARKVLVVVQFALSAFLVIGMFVVQRQIDYIGSAELGFDRDLVVVIRNFDETPNRDRDLVVRQAFASIPGVIKTGGFLEGMIGERGAAWPGVTMKLKDSPGGPISSMTQLVDGGYLETLGLKWTEGRNFSRDVPSDLLHGVILNETAVRNLGIRGSAVGHVIVNHTGAESTVIGVIEDFHASSLHHDIVPFMFYYSPLAWGAVVKLAGGDVERTLSRLERTWKEFVPEAPMDYYFLDHAVDRLYRSEQDFRALVSIMSGLALLIACLGLFGLAAFIVERRTKELAIRKVMGARVANLVTLVSKDLLVVVLLANLVAWPVGYFAMSRWLGNFAYHVRLGAAEFLLAGLVALVVATLTVTWQAGRAATANPVASLRND